MEYVTLNNGVSVPKVGFGIFKIPKEDTVRAVLDAIEVATVILTRPRAI